MGRRSRIAAALLTTVSLVAALGACSRDEREKPEPEGQRQTTSPSAADYAESMRETVTADAMFAHLEQLQQIADANDGTRAVDTPGYAESVDYVAKMLRDKGFDVQTPEFDFRHFLTGDSSLNVNGEKITANTMEYSIGTRPEGLSGPLVVTPAEETPGCSASDYDGLPIKGAIALVDRGSCQFSDKQTVAAELGAVALIIADNKYEEKMGGSLGAQTDVKIPVVSVSKTDGAQLRAQPGPAIVRVGASVRMIKARNVIAQTKTGSPQNVVLVGAHLDSVKEGPGINDNGSGVAAVLETAVQMGSSPPLQNAVRFAFWGAEELGIIGSTNYVRSLNEDSLKDIALYLNFDMVASPNPGYFTLDGDQSTPPGANDSPAPVPEGSAAIERTLVGYLELAGKAAEDASFSGRSDYDPFTQAGVPSGGLFTGAEGKMSAEQAERWDGAADEPFDPNYHQATDTVQHISRQALGINGSGVAYVVALYSQDINGRNGVPAREDRTRHVLKKS